MPFEGLPLRLCQRLTWPPVEKSSELKFNWELLAIEPFGVSNSSSKPFRR